MTAAPGRPVTYATEADARAYVAAVMAARAELAALGPVYVAAPPAVAMTGRWPELRAVLAGLLPGVPLAEWETMPADLRAARLPRSERAERLASGHRALVVVALREVSRRPLTGGVLAEARAFADAGRPVIVFTGRRLVAWADCRVRPVARAPRGRRGGPAALAAWLDVPPAPPRPLPTLAASLWALGVADPAAVARASAGVPGGGPGAPGADARPPLPRPTAARPAPPGAVFRPPGRGPAGAVMLARG